MPEKETQCVFMIFVFICLCVCVCVRERERENSNIMGILEKCTCKANQLPMINSNQCSMLLEKGIRTYVGTYIV